MLTKKWNQSILFRCMFDVVDITKIGKYHIIYLKYLN